MSVIRQLVNAFLLYWALQSTLKYFTAGNSKSTVTDSSGKTISVPPAGNFEDGHYYPAQLDDFLHVPEKLTPIWPEGTSMDMKIYLIENLFNIPSLSSTHMKNNLVFDEKNIKLADWDEKRSATVDVKFSDRVQHNGTLFALVFVARSGAEMDPRAQNYNSALSYNFFKQLTRYYPKKKLVKTKKLIGGVSTDEPEEKEPEVVQGGKPIIVSYWHSNLTLEVVGNGGILDWSTLTPPLKQHVVLETSNARDKSGRNGWYYPIVYPNDFWQLRDHMVELNHTVITLPLHINLGMTAWWKFQVFSSLDYSFKQSAANPNTALGQSASTGSELEEMKRVLIETNIYLLSTTIIVSLLHSIFEMLAFKNDISHWRNKKDNVGISFRTILANVFMQTIIFLYLLDNSEGTSWMILLGQGFSILVEAWKITRTVNIKILPTAPSSWFPYKIVFQDKHRLSQLEKETKAYDEEAFKYLYWVAVPLLLAYAGYSLVYETHKNWYSFVITTLVGSVYAYGFLMMVPSLYINYKLKSVAHMPRKTMIYKLLNTFIDDLFAFTIKMPTLHRLATLRDDVIYFIALYQSWIYRVDYRRINEFGQGGDDKNDSAKKEVLEEEKEKNVLAETSGVEPQNNRLIKRR